MRSQIRLAFNTLEEGATLSFPTPDGARKFNCAELKATLTNSGTEIILSGNIDGRVPYQGTILPNSISKLNVLHYLSETLAKKNHQGPSTEFSKMMGLITDEISKIILINSQAGKNVHATTEIHAPDLKWNRIRLVDSKKKSSKSLKTKKMVLFSSLSKEELGKLPYGALSGFINLEIQDDETSYDSTSWKRDGVEFIGVKTNPEAGVLARVSVRLSELLVRESLFFFHLYDKKSGEWIDVEGSSLLSKDLPFSVDVDLPESAYPLQKGELSFSFYVQGRYEENKIWLTKVGELYTAQVLPRTQKLKKKIKTKGEQSINLNSFESFSRWCSKKLDFGPLDSDVIFGDEVKGKKLLEYYHEALRRLSKRSSNNSTAIIRAVRTLGVNHVSIVSPEGPHAIAGGLAQVVKGLSMSFNSEGIPLTLISPLYEKSSGSSNLSANDIVRDGFDYLGERITLEESDDVLVPFGAILDELAQPLEVKKLYRVKTYKARYSKIEFLFIRHKKLADRLYGGMSSRDQLERALFLSRGSLEVLKIKNRNNKKSVLLSNDWLSALIEPLRNLDPAYKGLDKLKVIHILHNAGRGYQGRICIHENGVNAWGLLGLSDSCKELMLEDGSKDIINLTEAYIKLTTVGALTVSKPYAEQLLTIEHGEGLNKVISSKPIYGISNGISEALVRKSAFGENIGEGEEKETGLVLELKENLLKEAQLSLGLTLNKDAILAVMIGRLTEQKGISLLSPQGQECSVFESMLVKYPSLQIAVVGPGSERELEFEKFKRHVEYLSNKFPGRISARFEFVDPRQAIRYTAGASLFLMPSRYEPGGLTQLEAMCVGTSVVAHRVGGLSATLSQYTELSGSSFLFEDFSRAAFFRAFNEAVFCYLDKDIRSTITSRALTARNDWSHRVPYYLGLFQEILGVFNSPNLENTEFYKTRKSLINRVRARNY